MRFVPLNATTPVSFILYMFYKNTKELLSTHICTTYSLETLAKHNIFRIYKNVHFILRIQLICIHVENNLYLIHIVKIIS